MFKIPKLVLFLSGFMAFASPVIGKSVERGGYLIEMPAGWKMGLGTCTGDWSYSPVNSEGNLEVSLSVGIRRYLEKDTGLRSTADLYEIYSFSDIATAVPAFLETESRLVKSEKLKSRKGGDVLVLRFAGRESSRGSGITVLFAFIEADDRKSALEIACRYVEGEKSLGEKVFKAAVDSVSDPEPLKASRR